MVTDEGTRETEEGVNVKGKLVLVRVRGEGKERWVMLEEREVEKQN